MFPAATHAQTHTHTNKMTQIKNCKYLVEDTRTQLLLNIVKGLLVSRERAKSLTNARRKMEFHCKDIAGVEVALYRTVYQLPDRWLKYFDYGANWFPFQVAKEIPYIGYTNMYRDSFLVMQTAISPWCKYYRAFNTSKMALIISTNFLFPAKCFQESQLFDKMKYILLNTRLKFWLMSH